MEGTREEFGTETLGWRPKRQPMFMLLKIKKGARYSFTDLTSCELSKVSAIFSVSGFTCIFARLKFIWHEVICVHLYREQNSVFFRTSCFFLFGRLLHCVPFFYQKTLTSETLNASRLCLTFI